MHLGKLILGCVGLYQSLKALGSAMDGDSKREESNARRAIRGVRKTSVKVADSGAGKVKVYKVSELGDKKSAEERVRILTPLIIKGRVDPKVRNFAVRLLSQRCGKEWCVKEKDWRREVEVIFRALKERYRYIHDPVGIDHFSSARKILEMGGEDCDGAVVLLASTLGAVGYETRLVIIEVKYSSGDVGWHIYLEALIPERPPYWMPLDLTMDKPPGWEPPRSMIKRRYVFPIPS